MEGDYEQFASSSKMWKREWMQLICCPESFKYETGSILADNQKIGKNYMDVENKIFLVPGQYPHPWCAYRENENDISVCK